MVMTIIDKSYLAVSDIAKSNYAEYFEKLELFKAFEIKAKERVNFASLKSLCVYYSKKLSRKFIIEVQENGDLHICRLADPGSTHRHIKEPKKRGRPRKQILEAHKPVTPPPAPRVLTEAQIAEGRAILEAKNAEELRARQPAPVAPPQVEHGVPLPVWVPGSAPPWVIPQASEDGRHSCGNFHPDWMPCVVQ